jgi:hypothetical protein
MQPATIVHSLLVEVWERYVAPRLVVAWAQRPATELLWASQKSVALSTRTISECVGGGRDLRHPA